MSKPHICPICNGQGKVPQGFYNLSPYITTTTLGEELCKSCNGQGIVWESGCCQKQIDLNEDYCKK